MASGPWMAMPAEKPSIARPRMTLWPDSIVRPGKSDCEFVSGLVPSMITRTWALNPTVSAFGFDVISALTADNRNRRDSSPPDSRAASHPR